MPRKKKCKNCKEPFTPTFSTVQMVCSPKCAIEYSKELEEKKAAKKWRAEKKELKEKLKTLTDLEDEAKEVFQKFVRLRDQDKNCVSCDTPYSDIWDGGHFYKAEIYSGLIFDERNCHKQCRKCNRFLGGNENNYRLGLIKRFSESFVLQLDADAIQKRNHKFSRHELIEIKKKYLKKIRGIEV